MIRAGSSGTPRGFVTERPADGESATTDHPPTLPIPVSHIGMRVADIEAAISWYAEVLGFTLLQGPMTFTPSDAPALMTSVYGSQWSEIRQAHMASGNGAGLELFEFTGSSEVAPHPWRPGSVPWLGAYHFCITSPRIDSLATQITLSGGRQNMAVSEPAPETYQMVYCEDPFGNPVEINNRGRLDTTPGRR
jgi:catechol 2,3-dioxygenase-like lactoylglutathione lyase family enzyme